MLRIAGHDFDVDAYRQATGLTDETIFSVGRKGEPIYKSRPDKGIREWSYLSAPASDARFDQIARQKEEAFAFLTLYREQLSRCFEFGAESAVLDFGITCRLFDSSVGAQYYYFPPELITLLGTLGFGLELSQYRPSIGEKPRKLLRFSHNKGFKFRRR